MLEEFSLEGIWWLPQRSDTEVPGHLNFIPGTKLELNLQGILNDPKTREQLPPPDFIEPRIVLGIESKRGQKITLYKSRQFSHSFAMSGLHNTSFWVTAAFIGAHFELEGDPIFKEISVHFNNLEKWANRHPFTVEKTEDTSTRNFSLHYEHPKSLEAEIGDYTLKIDFLGPNTNPKAAEFNVAYETRVDIIPQKKTTFEDYIAKIRCIQDFFSLAMGTPAFPTVIKGLSDVNAIKTERGNDLRPPIDIYYLVPHWPEKLEETYQHQMLFTLPLIETDFKQHLSQWINKFDLLEPVVSLYFSVLYNPRSYAEAKFLSLVQAAETYHYRVFGGKYQTDEKYLAGLYKQLKLAIPRDLNKDFRKSLESKLQYANEFSLRKRLSELIRSVKGELDISFVRSSQEREAFISKVVDTRNYWTHYSPELAEKAVKTPEERLLLITKLQVIIEVCLLKELGFATKAIQDLIRRSRRLMLLRSKEKG